MHCTINRLLVCWFITARVDKHHVVSEVACILHTSRDEVAMLIVGIQLVRLYTEMIGVKLYV